MPNEREKTIDQRLEALAHIDHDRRLRRVEDEDEDNEEDDNGEEDENDNGDEDEI